MSFIDTIKNLTKFSKNNPNLANLNTEEAFKKISKDINSLAEALNKINANNYNNAVVSKEVDLTNVYNRIESLEKRCNQSSDGNIEDSVKSILNNNQNATIKRIELLEQQCLSLQQKSNQSAETIDKKVDFLLGELKNINKAFGKYDSVITELVRIVKDSERKISTLETRLEESKKNTSTKTDITVKHIPDVKPVATPKPEPVPVVKQESVEEPKIVNFNEQYIQEIKNHLKSLENLFRNSYYLKVCKAIDSVIEDIDEDEESELWAQIHSALSDNIYKKLDTISNEEKVKVTSFLENIGYRKLNFTENQLIDKKTLSRNFEYFDEKTDNENLRGRIKRIFQSPYAIDIKVDGDVQTFILKGNCTYYK